MNRSFEGLLVGRTLGGRYAVHEVIGRGGMSVVYRAVDGRLGREVALKVVSSPAEQSREELRERFRREAAAAARIPPHPNVVQLYDYGTDAELDLDHIAMEFLRGRDLKARLQDGPVAVDEGLRILQEAARGLAAGHRVGVVHRDVKPANIFLSLDGSVEVVKILDFGIAKALGVEPGQDLTRTGQLPHSPAYASPEQLDHARTLTPASDVYQLGLVGFETLTGSRPFTDEERDRIRAGEAVALPENARWGQVPAGLRAAISRALDTEPTRRFADAAAFARALSRDDSDTTLLAEEAMPGAPPPAFPPPLEPSPAALTRGTPHDARRRPGRMAQLVGGGVLALLGLLLISRMGRDPVAEEPPASAVLGWSDLDEEFRPLMRDAFETLQAEAADEEGAEAAAEVGRVVMDVNDAWVRGDLDRHLSYYADRVDFYGESGADPDYIARDRGAALERYSERNITLARQAIEFPEPGEARALVDKEWSFRGDDAAHNGAGRQEYRLELQDGAWKIVSEQMIDVYRAEETGR